MMQAAIEIVKRLIPGWLRVTPRPPQGVVVFVHNAPGSPYADVDPMTFDILVDFGPPTGQRVYEFQRPANEFPRDHDVHGPGVLSGVLIAWFGDEPKFTVLTGPPVTDQCDPLEPPP